MNIRTIAARTLLPALSAFALAAWFMSRRGDDLPGEQAGAHGREADATGSEQLIAFETWLRSRGANDLADKLVLATAQADRAMAQAQPQQPASVEAAADALGQLTRLMQAELAPALNVSIGFSDADGD